MKKTARIVLFLLCSAGTLPGQEKFALFWDFRPDQSFTIDKITKQTIRKDGALVRKKEIRDYVLLVPGGKSGAVTRLKGKYYSYLKDIGSSDPYQLYETYDLDFGMDRRGKYYIDEKQIMPSIRNIPLFPEKEISAGGMWRETGIEILEFTPPITLPVDVFYQVAGREKRLDKNCVKIVFHYLFNHLVEHNYPEVPYKFLGASYSSLWYDTDGHQPVYIENNYDIMFIYRNGTFIQYKGDLTGYYNLKRKQEEKEQVKEELYRQFRKSEKDMAVEKKEDAVVLDFGDINFEFDSAALTAEARKKLKRIGGVLKKYKDLAIIARGHTDDTGSDEYNEKLSAERARSVMNFLLENRFLKENQGSYQGMGKKEPKAGNRTPEGRRANRRVEIIIKPE